METESHQASTPGGHAAPRVSELERRFTPRVAAQVPTAYFVAGLSGPLHARTCDVGSAGICLETASPFAFGELHRVTLMLPDRELSLRAEGRWQRDASSGGGVYTGVRFVDCDLEARYALWSFVQKEAGEIGHFLRHSELDLELEDAMEVALFTKATQARAGEVIYDATASKKARDAFFIVKQGSVVLEAGVSGGRGSRGRLLLARRGPGEVFGGTPLIAGIPNPEVSTAELDTQLLEINGGAYSYLEGEHPVAAGFVRRAATRRQGLHLADLIRRLAAQ